MGHSYYQQARCHNQPVTLTVGDLIAKLQQHDPSLPVIFRSPQYGAFGSLHTYSLDAIAAEDIPERTLNHPAYSYMDDDSGEEVHVEACSETLNAWNGVVLS